MATTKKRPAKLDEQPGSPFNPDHYPPGKLPALTTSELQAICQKVKSGQVPTEEELDAAQAERRRALDKIEWVIETERPDGKERISSANATTRTTLTLDPLTVQGRDFCNRQKRIAAGPRKGRNDPLTLALRTVLPSVLDEPSRAAWDRLLGSSRIEGGDFEASWEEGTDRLRWRYQPNDPYDAEEKTGSITFESFATRVSRLKKQMRVGSR